jgi:hypothetical protein
MTNTLIICIPITALVVGFLVLKSVQLGLRWQIQLKNEEKPSMDVHNPITTIVNEVKEKQSEKEQANILNEWLNGPAESR